MHHDMCVGQGGVDFLDAVDTQHIACGRAGEFVGAVAGADGNRQRIHAGVVHETNRILHTGKHLVVGEFACRAHAVFFARFAGFQVAQHADFAFYRHTAGMGKIHHGTGNVHIVFVRRRGFTVGQQRAVHHHGRETELDGALAHIGRSAMVLVHHHGNMRKLFHRRQNQMAQKGCAGIFARTGRCLHDYGRIDLVGRLHNRTHLFEVVDVEGGQAVAMLGGMVEQLAHGYESHSNLLK